MSDTSTNKSLQHVPFMIPTDWLESMLLFWKCKKNTFAAGLWARINCVYWFCSSIVVSGHFDRGILRFSSTEKATLYFFSNIATFKEFTHKEDKIPSKINHSFTRRVDGTPASPLLVLGKIIRPGTSEDRLCSSCSSTPRCGCCAGLCCCGASCSSAAGERTSAPGRSRQWRRPLAQQGKTAGQKAKIPFCFCREKEETSSSVGRSLCNVALLQVVYSVQEIRKKFPGHSWEQVFFHQCTELSEKTLIWWWRGLFLVLVSSER